MMIRTAVVFALLFSAVVMMRGVASDWQESPIASPSGEGVTKKAAATPGNIALPSVGKRVQPLVPATLPDLREGYLFNQERVLANTDFPPAQEGNANDESTVGVGAAIDDVTYVGSLITKGFRRALIVFPAPPKATKGRPRIPMRRPSAASGAEEEHAQLKPGDMLDGYKVTEILPDKLVFVKGDETVEKLLYDVGKKRTTPPTTSARGAVGGQPQPGAQKGGAPSSSGVRTTTIGGGASSPERGRDRGNSSPSFASPNPIILPPETTPLRAIQRMINSQSPGTTTNDTIATPPMPGEVLLPQPPGVNSTGTIATPPTPGGS